MRIKAAAFLFVASIAGAQTTEFNHPPVYQIFTPTTTKPGLNVGSFNGNPAGATNGALWYNTATGKIMGQVAGSPVDLAAGSSAFVDITGAATDNASLVSLFAQKNNAVFTGTFVAPNSTITNAMLAGSIASSKLIGTDIVTVGNITAGTWSSTIGAVAGASLTNGKPGVVVRSDDGIETYFKPTGDTDAERGTALINAAATLVTGDHLWIGPGTYALAASRLTLPDNATVVMEGCTITSTVAIATGCIVRPGANNKIVGAGTIQGVAADGIIQAPIGWITSETPKTGVLISGIRMVADADGFYVSHSTVACGVVLRDCTFETEYDAVVAFGDVGGAVHAVDVYNPRIIVTGPSSIGTGISRGAAASYNSVIRIFGGSIQVTNGGTSINAGVYAFTSGTIEVYDTAITTSNGANPTADLWNSGSTLRVTGGKGSGSNGVWTTNGTVTYMEGRSMLPLSGGTMTGALLFTDNTIDIGAAGATRPRTIYLGTSAFSPKFEVAAGIHWTSGTGSPEGVVTANIGALYSRNNGGDNTTIYIKASGAGNTGWLPALTSASGTGDVTAAVVFGNDNRIVRSDGTAKGVQASGWTIDDADSISGGVTVGAAIDTTSSAANGAGLRGTGSGSGGIGVHGINGAAAGIGVQGQSSISGGVGILARGTAAGAIPFQMENENGFKASHTFLGTAARSIVWSDLAGVPALSASALTSGRIPFVTTGGALADEAALLYNSGTDTLTAGTLAGAGGGLTLDASGFNGNLLTTDNTLQEVAQKLDDLGTVWNNLAGGTVLTVSNNYYDTLSAPRTLTFSGTPVNGSKIEMFLIVSGGTHILTIPTARQIGATSTTTTLNLPTANHSIKFEYKNAEWTVTDSSVSNEAAHSVWANPTSSSALPLFTDSPVVNGLTVNTAFAAKADVLEASLYAADAGSNDTYVITLSPAITAYVAGAHYRFKANTANTGAATLNINGVGAKTIKKVAGGITTDLADNDIRAGQFVEVVYDGTNLQMQSTLGNAGGGDPPAEAYTRAGWDSDPTGASKNDVSDRDELLKGGSIAFSVDGGGSVITTGTQKAKAVVPFACTITKCTVLADTSTSTTCDIWKNTYANYPPTIANTIVASAKPTLSAAIKSEDSTLTGWTTSVAAGDILYFTVDTNNNATHLDIILTTTR